METAQLVIGVTLGGCALLGILTGLLRKTVKYYLSELKPDGNGGHNLHGRVERIELRVDHIYALLLDTRLNK